MFVYSTIYTFYKIFIIKNILDLLLNYNITNKNTSPIVKLSKPLKLVGVQF